MMRCFSSVFWNMPAIMGGGSPFDDFLRKAASSLKDGGKLYIAIENKLGMKNIFRLPRGSSRKNRS